jgi:hypothetical protein
MTTIMMDKITKEYKKAMKGADSVSFRLTNDGQSQIELNKKVVVDGFETECRKIIKVGTRKVNYEKFGKEDEYYGNYEIENGFCWISYANQNMEWQTVVKNLKADDEIILEWMAGNNHQLLEDNGFSNDELALIIRRKDENILKFKIDSQITNKWSSARMIKVVKKVL